jgi:hypothetical protein
MFCWNNNRAHTQTLAVLVFFGMCLTACNRNEPGARLYPIDSLVTAQIINLTQSKAVLHKRALMGSRSDSIVYTPKDTSAWISELDIFRQLEVINKPVSRASYLIDDNLYDPGSNLTVKAFTSTTNLPVRHMRIYYDRSVRQPRKIEAHYDEENSLYQSSRLLLLEFQQINNKTVLTSYAIKGGQKMILGDSVAFTVKGKILIDYGKTNK